MQAGESVGGKYVIERLLGEGGMGSVYLARQERLDRKVAIKFLRAGTDLAPEAHARFAREARAAAVLESEHVTRVIDVGQLDDGSPYMVMEYLQGEDFSAALERQGTPPGGEGPSTSSSKRATLLAEAHERGIVHRDLTPANHFSARRSNGTSIVKVLDVGISKAQGAAQGGALTSTRALMGSPLYMSPEQLKEARNVDARADIWALGVILYELLTGKTPFQSEASASSAPSSSPPRRRQSAAFAPTSSPALEAIIAKCLEKEPANRFATVSDLVAALRGSEHIPVANPSLVSAPSLPAFSASHAGCRPLASAARTGDGMANTHGLGAGRASRGPILGVVGGVGVVAVLVTLLVVRGHAPPAPPPAAPANAAALSTPPATPNPTQNPTLNATPNPSPTPNASPAPNPCPSPTPAANADANGNPNANVGANGNASASGNANANANASPAPKKHAAPPLAAPTPRAPAGGRLQGAVRLRRQREQTLQARVPLRDP